MQDAQRSIRCSLHSRSIDMTKATRSRRRPGVHPYMRPGAIHHIAEADLRIGVGPPNGSTRTGVTEATRTGTEARFRPAQEEAQAEPRRSGSDLLERLGCGDPLGQECGRGALPRKPRRDENRRKRQDSRRDGRPERTWTLRSSGIDSWAGGIEEPRRGESARDRRRHDAL
jgi:hypothetical protein